VVVSEQGTRQEPSGPRRGRSGTRSGGRGPSHGAVGDGLVRSPRGDHFEIVERAGPVELQRAPAIPAEAREELLVIKDGELFLCARTDRDIAPARVSGEGFYAYDTRYLSEVRLEVGGARPVALSFSTIDERAVVDSTNAQLRRGALEPIPQLSLSVTRELMIAFRAPVLPDPPAQLPARASDHNCVAVPGGGLRRHVRGARRCAARRSRSCVSAKAAGARTRARIRRRGRGVSRVDCRAEPDSGRSRSGSSSRACQMEGPARAAQAEGDPDHHRAVDRRTPASASAAADRSGDNKLFDGLITTAIRDLRALIMPRRAGRSSLPGSPGMWRRSGGTRS
jgi:hypothetical protein